MIGKIFNFFWNIVKLIVLVFLGLMIYFWIQADDVIEQSKNKLVVENEPKGDNNSYVKELHALVKMNLEYPKEAHRNSQEGKVTLKIKVFKDGSLEPKLMEVLKDLKYAEGRNMNVNYYEYIERSSGFSSLDKAALLAVAKSLPLPKMPEDLENNFYNISLPFFFKLN